MMNNYKKWMDSNPRWLRVVLCISFLDITWGLYRLFSAILKKDVLRIILSVAWILWAGMLGWILDLIFMLIKDHIFWFKD